MERTETVNLAAETDENGIESNLRAIARAIFSEPPRPPGSFGLELEDDLPPGISPRHHINRVLTYFLLHGIATRWGNIALKELGGAELEVIRQYVRSIGYELELDLESDPGHLLVDFTPGERRSP